jgi:hypothetical protein
MRSGFPEPESTDLVQVLPTWSPVEGSWNPDRCANGTWSIGEETANAAQAAGGCRCTIRSCFRDALQHVSRARESGRTGICALVLSMSSSAAWRRSAEQVADAEPPIEGGSSQRLSGALKNQK